MGVQSLILGFIEEAWPGVAAGGDPAVLAHLEATARAISAHNEDVLRALPEADAFPPLCRPMFGWPPPEAPMITYPRNRLIHLAASMNQIDSDLRDWLDKFERLLRRLYWESAFVRVQTAYLGTHEFSWRPSDDWSTDMHKGRLRPVTDWTFTSTMDAADLNDLRG